MCEALLLGESQPTTGFVVPAPHQHMQMMIVEGRGNDVGAVTT